MAACLPAGQQSTSAPPAGSVNISTGTTLPRISEGRAILNRLETSTRDLIELAIWDGRTRSFTIAAFMYVTVSTGYT